MFFLVLFRTTEVTPPWRFNDDVRQMPSGIVDQVVGGPVIPVVRLNRVVTFPTHHGRTLGRPVRVLR